MCKSNVVSLQLTLSSNGCSFKPVATLKQRILDKIRELRKGVSFVQLSRLDGFAGTYELRSGQYPNILFWAGMSLEAVTAVNELKQEGRIEHDPIDVLAYMIDGASLRLPVATDARHYKKPHWLPTVFRIAESKP